jgi:hypothetical protein
MGKWAHGCSQAAIGTIARIAGHALRMSIIGQRMRGTTMRHVVRLIRRNSIVNPEHLDIMRPANPTAGPFALAECQNTQQGSLFISKTMSMKVRRNNFMKRHGNLYQQIISRENIELAAQHARKRKTWQRAVKKFDEHRICSLIIHSGPPRIRPKKFSSRRGALFTSCRFIRIESYSMRS